MLIRFSFKNFRSVGADPVTLDMVSTAKIRSFKNIFAHRLKVPMF